jgi:hypothetical protein
MLADGLDEQKKRKKVEQSVFTDADFAAVKPEVRKRPRK